MNQLSEYQRTVLYKDKKMLFVYGAFRVDCFGCKSDNAQLRLAHTYSSPYSFALVQSELSTNKKIHSSICKECLQEFRLHPREFIFKIRLGLL